MRGIINIIKQKFRTSDEKSLKLRNNIIITFLFKGGSLLVNLALVPITIHYVNPTEYGIWLTLSSIIAWFGVSDIGFGHGLRNRFAEAVAVGDKRLARSYVSTTYVAFTILMIVMWCAFFIVNNFLDWSAILNASDSSKTELAKVVLIVYTFFSAQLILRLLGIVLTANQEPGKASGFDFISNIFLLVSILILIHLNTDGALKTLAVLSGIYQVGVLVLASFWFYTHELKEYRPSIKYFEKKQIRSLMGLGIKFFIIQVSMIFVFQSTNIIITQLTNPEQVSIYNTAYKYFTIPMTIALIIVTPLWSAFTDAYTKGEFDWMKRTYKKVNFLTLLVTLMLIVIFIISPCAYKIWLKDALDIPISVSFFMMLNIIAATFFSVRVILINGIGKIKLQLVLYIIFSILFIPLAIWLGKFYNLSGIIVANIFINIIFSIFTHIQCKKLINKKASGIWNE